MVIRGPDALAPIQMPCWDCGGWTADPLRFPTRLEPWEYVMICKAASEYPGLTCSPDWRRRQDNTWTGTLQMYARRMDPFQHRNVHVRLCKDL